MAYIKITNGTQEAYNLGQLRRDNKGISFPKTIEASTLASYGVYSVVVADQPSYIKETEVIARDTVAVEVDGQYTYCWSVRPKTSEELEEDLALLAGVTRAKRDELLASTDWTANSDVTMTEEMTAYRQALRDIPAQAGFPNTVAWPVKP